MTPRRTAFGMVAAATIVVVVVIVSTLGFVPVTKSTPAQSSSTGSGGNNLPPTTSTNGFASSSLSQWQVLARNLTISDHEQMTPCSVFLEYCPLGGSTTFPARVLLISYEGNYYYAYNHTRQFDQQPPITSTVWFTNSTVYCVTPQWQSYTACPTWPSAFSATMTSSTVSCPSNTTCGSFAYAPTRPVQVDSVQAKQQNANGEPAVIFAVTFENIGDSSIYIPDGSNGVTTSVPPNSSVLHGYTSARCAGTFRIVKLDPGQNYTLYGPPCGDGFDYALVQLGSVNVTFSFNWSTNSKASENPTDFQNSTTISAQFTFA